MTQKFYVTNPIYIDNNGYPQHYDGTKPIDGEVTSVGADTFTIRFDDGAYGTYFQPEEKKVDFESERFLNLLNEG